MKNSGESTSSNKFKKVSQKVLGKLKYFINFLIFRHHLLILKQLFIIEWTILVLLRMIMSFTGMLIMFPGISICCLTPARLLLTA